MVCLFKIYNPSSTVWVLHCILVFQPPFSMKKDSVETVEFADIDIKRGLTSMTFNRKLVKLPEIKK